ncbi:hypothetical protein [Azospirillum sp. B4]|uniref:hypothetical protein n=1 Tax=Azospirillum sp. B4 TaxID=95605 RepID=UPI00034C1462|nr:hypothetical protein [Azospirillum sp. B4]
MVRAAYRSRRPLHLRALPLALGGLLLTGGLVSGCAERPVAASFMTRPQYKMETVAHWTLVANDVASAVSAYLQEQTGQKPPVQVYLTRHSDTTFADAFQQALTTAFVQNGHAVAMEPKPDVVMVSIDANAIAHPKFANANRSVPGPLTAIGAGVAVGKFMLDAVPWGITAAAAGLALDAGRATVDETSTELVLTASISRASSVVASGGALSTTAVRKAQTTASTTRSRPRPRSFRRRVRRARINGMGWVPVAAGGRSGTAGTDQLPQPCALKIDGLEKRRPRRLRVPRLKSSKTDAAARRGALGEQPPYSAAYEEAWRRPEAISAIPSLTLFSNRGTSGAPPQPPVD